MKPGRRDVLAALAGLGAAGTLGLPPGLALAGDGEPFDFERLKALAREIARSPHVPRPEAAGDLAAVTYDEGFRVVFDPARTVSMGADWGLQFFPLGTLNRRAVQVHLVENGLARPLVYDPSWFLVPSDSPFKALPADIGFAGFRVVQGAGRAERLSYIGASYFRSPGPFNQYGLSARALALDTYSTGPEEFPDFTRFWLAADGEGRLVIHALLEGPGVVGAYRFITDLSTPETVQQVEAELIYRKGFDQPGLAPLTSMFWYGENTTGEREDWRPEVHDSDGLALWTGTGERIWRPLNNPPRVVTSAFADRNPRGFGLIQRDRDYTHYHDDQAFYDRRPSLWVEPEGAWGAGSVRLIEIPTRSEVLDNIVAFWTPDAAIVPGRPQTVRYRLTWGDDVPGLGDLARVVSTRLGRIAVPGGEAEGSGSRVAVAFLGDALSGLGVESGVRPVVRVSGGTTSNVSLAPGGLPPDGGERLWRLILDVQPSGTEPADLRVWMAGPDGQRLSEIWCAQVFPH